MTKFNPQNKESLTYGESLGPAMKITDPEDAKQYMNDYISFIQMKMNEHPEDYKSTDTAEKIAKSNLGYFSGYYDNETMKRVQELFMASHPIFGGYENMDTITPQKAFEMGKNYSKKIKRKKKLDKLDKYQSEENDDIDYDDDKKYNYER